MIENKIKKKTSEELINMINNKERFENSFVFAAHKELKNRNINYSNDEIDAIIIEKKEQKKVIKEKSINFKKTLIESHKNINLSIRLLSIGIGINILQIIFDLLTPSISFGINFNNLEIPFGPQLISILIMILVIRGLKNGDFFYRYLYLIIGGLGIIFNVMLAIFLINEVDLILISTFIAILTLIMVSIKTSTLYYLFNKTTRNWLSETTNML